jgi:hypothetical protein
VDIEPLKAAYWEIVTDCLVQFHGFARPAAEAVVVGLRDRVESPQFHDAPPEGYESDSFFHGEPFHVACDLAGRNLDLNDFRSEYEPLMTGRYSAAETVWPRCGQPDRVQYAGGLKR